MERRETGRISGDKYVIETINRRGMRRGVYVTPWPIMWAGRAEPVRFENLQYAYAWIEKREADLEASAPPAKPPEGGE